MTKRKTKSCIVLRIIQLIIIKPKLGKIKLAKLTNLDLQKFYKYLLEDGRIQRKESEKQSNGLSAKTVRNIHQVIMSALEVAKSQEIIIKNPAEKCSLPKKEHREMKTLNQEDLQKFFESAKKENMYELFYIDIITGLRRGELLGLKWKDIDFKSRVISVKRQVLRVDGEVVESPLKTKNSYRNISIGEDAVNLLRKLKKDSNSEYVFSTEDGKPLPPDSLRKILHRILNNADLPIVRFHDLRHTFATLALQNGVDIKTVSGMLGHFSAGFTLDTYTHVTTQSQVNAAIVMGDVVGVR